MESQKLDVEAATLKGDTELVTSTYKAIPEDDFLDKVPEGGVKNSNMVKENGDLYQDGADEKMLAPKEGAEVKFISGHNGDAKIDIENVKQVFTGMTKDELMKYANDPFWVRLRWVMFVLFWLLWIAMLAGAIAIIIGAPKCAAPEPKTWWEQGPLFEIDLADAEKGLLTKSAAEGLGHGDNNNLLPSDLKNLKDLGVQSIVLSIPDDFDIYNQKYDAIEKIVKDARNNDIYVIFGVQANFVPKTSPLFAASENSNETYKDYFIWGDDKSGSPPSNWNAVTNGSAWTKSSIRSNQYYLHQFGTDKPDLNFNKQEVRDLFKTAIQRWVSFGVSGIRLSHAKYLLVNQKFADESTKQTGPAVDLGDYSFYSHAFTANQEGLGELIKEWKKTLLNATNDEGVIYINEDIETPSAFRVNGTLLVPNLPADSRTLLELSKQNSSAKELYNNLKNVDALDWKHWIYSSGDSNQISEHNIIAMLLPGVPEISPSQLYGVNPNATQFELKELIALRKLPSVQYGTFSAHLVANESVVSFTRLKSGNPGIFCLYNPGWTDIDVNLETVKSIPPEVTILVASANYNAKTVKTKLSSNNVPMPKRSALVLSYVPKSEE